jgi:hypothetical protein
LVLTSIVIGYAFEQIQGMDDARLRAIWSAIVGGLLLASLVTPLGSGLQQFGYILYRQRANVALVWGSDFDTLQAGIKGWPCLDAFAELPPDKSLATTETGLPSVIAPDSFILDLHGLHSTEIALGRISQGDAISAHKIDIVYLPTELYNPEIRTKILSSDAFAKRNEYEVFYWGVPGSPDIALRRDSPYLAKLRACVKSLVPPDTKSADYLGIQSDQYYYLPLPYPLKPH